MIDKWTDDSNSAQGGTKAVSRFFMQLLYLPVTIFMAGVNALGRACGSNQSSTSTGVPGAGFSGAPPGGIGGFSPPRPNVGGFSMTPVSGTAVPINTGFRNPNTKERSMGVENNQDLSNDDIKTVLYSIIFVKRDLETILQEQRLDVVSYVSDGPSYGALKMGEFTATGTFDRPESWITSNYPPGVTQNTGLTVADIPADDRRYIKIEFKVTDRRPKSEADYEKRKTKALERIADNTDRI
jgi:hypothetical protein